MSNLRKIRRAYWRTVERTGKPPRPNQPVILPRRVGRIRLKVKRYPFGTDFTSGAYHGLAKSLYREFRWRQANGLLGEVANRVHGSGCDEGHANG